MCLPKITPGKSIKIVGMGTMIVSIVALLGMSYLLYNSSNEMSIELVYDLINVVGAGIVGLIGFAIIGIGSILEKLEKS